MRRIPCASVALLVVVTFSLSGCGGGGTPAPTPAPAPPPTPPTPSPTPPPTAPNVPDPASWTYRIPESKNFHCITDADRPTATAFDQYGFYMYRWTTKKEVTEHRVSTDSFSDINPYYFIANLMTSMSGRPLASKAGGCHISHCGADGDECVLERVYMMYNSEAVQSVTSQGIWGQHVAIDNGIPNMYSYWAFNFTGVENPQFCQEDTYTLPCNFYFRGGYPIGCNKFSDFLDTPVWYSVVGGCAQYPYNKETQTPEKVSGDFVWHNKLDDSDPEVAKCFEEMRGGDYCEGGQKTPFEVNSKTCTWKAMQAGYLDVLDVLNVASSFTSYTDWCLADATTETDYGHGSGIPSDMTFFANLSSKTFPVLDGLSAQAWITAASGGQSPGADVKKVFQNWAKYAKVRLEQMFDEMEKQAFAQYTLHGQTDPNGRPYQNCLSRADFTVPACSLGVEELVV
eukprot:CAMPEP_0194511862 /NCGR_PEP_ID=MMETSP0253-20130528/43652_1 /TAXON_ID=2966 /ORGANISM="Noctiluca scintillans" /LENGTH=454 /DNA_ID=CAMNT_0039355237 /DNA_START=74 /DNA_END=1438 /DNA_ORIENTATION=+